MLLLRVYGFDDSRSVCVFVFVLGHEPAYTSPPPSPPPPRPPGILPHGNFWVPWPSKYAVQVACKWAVAVCVCGAGSNEMHYEHYMEFQTAVTLSLGNSFIMNPPPLPPKRRKKQKKKEAISIYCFIVWTV